MFIGSLLPAAVAARKLRRASPGPLPRAVWPQARQDTPTDLPHGVAMVEAETQTALAALNAVACDRFVELQVACEPHLFARAEPGDLQSCLRGLLSAAIDRATSGVLVTATKQPDTIEITVMDDGCVRTGIPAAEQQLHYALPAGASLTASYRRDEGTTVVLHVPRATGQDDDDVEEL